MYTDKMHKSLRRETEGKKNQVVDLLDEIERLQNREAPSRRQSLTMPDGSKLLVGADRKKLIKNINTYFATDFKNIKEINYEDMMWYLECVFLWYKMICGTYEDFKASIRRTDES